MNFYPEEDDDIKINEEAEDEPLKETEKKKTDRGLFNPPPFTDGHNPFGEGGIYSPGDPGL